VYKWVTAASLRHSLKQQANKAKDKEKDKDKDPSGKGGNKLPQCPRTIKARRLL